MMYHLTVDILENDLHVKNKSFQFSEDRWFSARVQVLTVLEAIYSDDWDRITLYLDNMDRARMESGTYYSKATVRAVFEEADFNEYLFEEDLSFDQIKRNLIMEHDLYKVYSNFNFLTEQVQFTDAESIELLKGTNKLLGLYFQSQ